VPTRYPIGYRPAGKATSRGLGAGRALPSRAIELVIEDSRVYAASGEMAARILVLEDNAHLANALSRLLKRVGYDVVQAECCAAALASSGYFDLGVFDLELPDGGGIDVSSELMSIGNLGAVVFFTATLDGALFKRAERTAPCIQKTDGIEVLLDAIRRTLSDNSRHAAGGGNGKVMPMRGGRRGR
jgi:DNA-binding NtrC family response regulator